VKETAGVPVRVLVVPQNLDRDKFVILKEVLRMHPGPNVIVLRVDDEDIELKLQTVFCEDDRATFEDILGPCTISTLGPVVADVGELIAGVKF
jgi:hypothetical protein